MNTTYFEWEIERGYDAFIARKNGRSLAAETYDQILAFIRHEEGVKLA